MRERTLHLASASPRRREILEALGLVFTFAGVDLDETPRRGEAADAMVLRLATEKALAAAGEGDDRVILGADTVVILGDRILGKPRSADDALQMLAELSGRTHDVLTGVALCHGGRVDTAISRSSVRFREIPGDEAARYWQSGEPRDKAGAYAIQGLGGVFVESLRGSYSGVVGLPVFETAQLLRDAGIEILPRSGK